MVTERGSWAAIRWPADAWLLSREALPMLALAVVGLLASGTLLERLAQWNSFVKVDKFMILSLIHI